MKTLLVISGVKYDLADAFARPSLNDLVALKMETGLGMQSLRKGIEEIDQLVGGINSDAFFERPDLMNVLRTLIWLARRGAGETVTFEEASAFPWDEFNVVTEDDEGKTADPTSAATGSAPAAAKATPRKRSTTSRTSAKRS